MKGVSEHYFPTSFLLSSLHPVPIFFLYLSHIFASDQLSSIKLIESRLKEETSYCGQELYV
jgi:hypothetical protein